ncbi:unnamed protein product, partial [Didymodactylos carnosus]
MKVSHTTMRRIIKEDLGLKLRSFGIWGRKNIRKSMTEKILFAEEKYFYIDEIYNKQNDRIYAPTREEADRKGGMHFKTQHPVHVMVWLRSCYQEVTRPVIIEKGTINAARYIEEILPVALKDGKRLLGNDFIFQQDSASLHKDGKTQSWCKQYFP